VVIVRVGTSGAGDGSPPPRVRQGKPLARIIPWPIGALFLGVLLAVAAAALVYEEQQVLAMPVFLLAAAVIIAGCVGLVFFYKREQAKVLQEEEDDSDRSPPRVYRQVPCRIELPLLEKLARATEALSQRAAERQWQPDWNGFQQHQDLAQKHLNDGDLAGAFREHCRALGPLIEVMLSNRSKDEPGPPIWERDGG
jgi:hypothetical protein